MQKQYDRTNDHSSYRHYNKTNDVPILQSNDDNIKFLGPKDLQQFCQNGSHGDYRWSL